MPDRADDVTALGRLIRDVQAANRWSYADIAHNAVAAGRRLSKSRVESLRNDPLPSISIKAIEALAAGLKVPPHRVAEAAMESMGFTVANEGLQAADALAEDPALSDAMRRVLLAALKAAHQESAADASHPRTDRASDVLKGNRLQRAAADDESTGPEVVLGGS